MTLYRTSSGAFHFGRTRPLSREAIADTLAQIKGREGGMRYLREVLRAEVPRTVVDSLDDKTVIERVTALVRGGNLQLVFLRPSDARVPAFFVEGDGKASSDGPKNKAIESKPSPIVPPEYPVLASVESDKVIDSTAKLNAKLTALMFGQFKRQKRETTIGREYILVASAEGSGVKLASTNVDIKIGIELHVGLGKERPKPSVPVEFVSTAKSTGAAAKFAVEKLGKTLEQSTNKAARPAPALPEVFVGVAGQTAQGAKSTTLALGQSLGTLLHTTPFVRTRSAVVEDE